VQSIECNREAGLSDVPDALQKQSGSKGTASTLRSKRSRWVALWEVTHQVHGGRLGHFRTAAEVGVARRMR
jgi:hypothetical protein